jgi:uncharacterized membrane protein YhiD involved in acid resistance
MIMLEDGFKAFPKGPLQKILRNATNKLYKSIPVGAAVTALIQSSSLVSVITISFISAGLVSLSGGLGFVFGANIGTTATAWLVAGFGLKIKISALAMPMLIFGIIFSFQKEYDNLRRKIVKVLRVIYLYRTDISIEKHQNKLSELKEEAKLSIHSSNESINKLIRENKINVDMGSSLVNDNDNVNDIIKKLIYIAELLYEKRDSLLENNT